MTARWREPIESIFDDVLRAAGRILLVLPAALLAVLAHEYAHALTAHRMGDRTPEQLGRLSVNPLVHIDFLGFILLVLWQVGWSRSIPAVPLRPGESARRVVLVALSGSAANLAVAAVFFLVVSLLGGPGQIFHVAEIPGKFALVLIRMNLAMGLVNLLPLPPFDGVRLVDLAGFRLSRLEPFGAVAFFVAGAAGLAPLVSAATDGIVRRML